MDILADRLQQVRENLEAAAIRAGRSGAEVQIMAVTKNFGPEAVRAALDAGLHLMGENRVQEALGKHPGPGTSRDYRLHLIGPLQSNKVRKAAGFFDMVQSVDRGEILAALDRACGDIGTRMDVLLEYNTSGEASKHGVTSPDALFRLVDQAVTLDNIRCRGLMTLGPLGGSDSDVHKAFALLRTLAERVALTRDLPDFSLLSMGMSQDYAIAVEEGSTLIRIGTLLFGDRS